MAGRGLDAASLNLGLSNGTAIPLADELAEFGDPFRFATACRAVTGERHAHVPVIPKPFEARHVVAALARLLHGGEPTRSNHHCWSGVTTLSGALRFR